MCQDVTLSSQDSIIKNRSENPNLASTIATHMEARIGKDRFDLWFSQDQSFSVHSTTSANISPRVIVSAENSFSLQRIKGTLADDVRDIVNHVCGPHFQIQYQLSEVTPSDSSSDENDETSIGQDSASSQSLRLASDDNQRRKMPTSIRKAPRGVSSFSFGPDNRLIEAGVEQLFREPGQFAPFFVFGPTGSGKSHLLESITNDFRRRLRLKRCVYLSAEQFTSEFVGSLRGGTGLPMFRRKYRDLDLLAIDDIQFLAGKRATLGEFQHTMDNLIRSDRKSVV